LDEQLRNVHIWSRGTSRFGGTRVGEGWMGQTGISEADDDYVKQVARRNRDASTGQGQIPPGVPSLIFAGGDSVGREIRPASYRPRRLRYSYRV
jgi:hypothetical protein